MMEFQRSQIGAVENYLVTGAEEVHDRRCVGAVPQAQGMTQFVHGSQKQVVCREGVFTIEGNPPLKPARSGELGPGDLCGLKQTGVAIHDLNCALAAVFCVPRHVQNSGPEVQSTCKLHHDSTVRRREPDSQVHSAALEQFVVPVTWSVIAGPVAGNLGV